jgi:hypothetical protein
MTYPAIKETLNRFGVSSRVTRFFEVKRKLRLILRSEIRAVAALSVAVPVLCLFSAAQQQDQA